MKKSYSGVYKPIHPKKYTGDVDNIIYRSSWEAKYMRWLDLNPSVISWSSEEMSIPYLSEIDGKVHRYFPDFIVKMQTTNGPQTFMVEIKPEKQTKPPQEPKRKTKTFIQEVITWGINQSKWKSAQEYCKDRSWKFVILTEKQLFNDKPWNQN